MAYRQRISRYFRELWSDGGMSRHKCKLWLAFALTYEGDECLLWPFRQTRTGYGEVVVDSVHWRVNRYIATKVYGAPPHGKNNAAHKCGQKLCGNKRHIRWASRVENEADKIGHSRTNRGERCGTAKLTALDVSSIRIAHTPAKALADQYKVDVSHIHRIKKREVWAWLK